MKGELSPTITAEQRKALADLLKPNGVARGRALEALRDAERKLRGTLIEEEAEKCGALTLAREVTDLERRKDDHEHKLQAFGFGVDSDGEISLRYDAPRAVRQSIEERVRQKLESERDIERKYDRAMTKVLTATSAEEAATIVESLL